MGIEDQRCSCINHIAGFCPVLLLALGIDREAGNISHPGQAGSSNRSERRASPGRVFLPAQSNDGLGGPQAEKGGEGDWHTEQRDGGSGSGRDTRIARQSLCEAETSMSARCPRKDACLLLWRRRTDLGKRHLDPLVMEQLHTGAPVLLAVPVLPEQGGSTNLEGMEQHTHLTRLARLVTVPLTLLAQWADTTVADASRIDNA